VEESVRDSEKVLNRKVFNLDFGLTGTELDVDGMIVDLDRPEQAVRIRINAGIKVVNLSGKIDEVKLTSVEVQSDEPKRPVMYLPVLADVHSFHEPHVGVIE
jgi:hypothetical protein